MAQREVIENLYGFTFSLLMPDLPVEFWWPGNLPYENVFFDKMAEQASRVWVDSSKFKEPVQSLARLSAFWDSRYPHTLLGDLNWIRIQRWRALIAEMFDGEWAKYLKDVKKVSIAYGERNPTHPEFFPGSAGWPPKWGGSTKAKGSRNSLKNSNLRAPKAWWKSC